jgi:hypothetical protein
MPAIPLALYPGLISLHTREEIHSNTQTILTDQIVKSLTHEPIEAELPK